jgi:isoquinoline 1-oxidoreductase beta subunit
MAARQLDGRRLHDRRHGFDFTYDIPNLELRTVIQDVGIGVGYLRPLSNALNAFAIESFVDQLVHAAGRDLVVFRLAMLDKVPRQRGVLERAPGCWLQR